MRQLIRTMPQFRTGNTPAILGQSLPFRRILILVRFQIRSEHFCSYVKHMGTSCAPRYASEIFPDDLGRDIIDLTQIHMLLLYNS